VALMSPRDRLASVLAPDVLDALDALVAERVTSELARLDAGARQRLALADVWTGGRALGLLPTLAMQKVVGSSPIIRSLQSPAEAGFLFARDAARAERDVKSQPLVRLGGRLHRDRLSIAAWRSALFPSRCSRSPGNSQGRRFPREVK
jgi:hypothetical protein